MISLRPVDSSNYRECIELTVAPEQERFVASNVQSLAEAYVWREGAEPYAVYSDDEMIGFALLFPLGEDEPDGSVPPSRDRPRVRPRPPDDRPAASRAAASAGVRSRRSSS